MLRALVGLLPWVPGVGDANNDVTGIGTRDNPLLGRAAASLLVAEEQPARRDVQHLHERNNLRRVGQTLPRFDATELGTGHIDVFKLQLSTEAVLAQLELAPARTDAAADGAGKRASLFRIVLGEALATLWHAGSMAQPVPRHVS